MTGLKTHMGIDLRSQKGVHNCVACEHSKDGYCTLFKKWAFRVGRECEK